MLKPSRPVSAEIAKVEFPELLAFLFERFVYRYKGARGGRGGAKSWSFAIALLILGAQFRLRILCARETQKSIADSVHKLLADQVRALGLSGFYDVQKAAIFGKNGTEIFFAGLKHNISNIKSIESCDIVWVEEAQAVSKRSWEVLVPTIRKKGSEIWITFNPELETDDTYKRFVVHPPPRSKIVEINYSDNPWLQSELVEEMENLKASDYDAYLHVWEGKCKQMLDGAVYANELRAAELEKRITRVPYDRTKPVDTFWDLGFADSTSIWCVQSFPFEFRFIDYIEGSQKPLEHYQRALQAKGYVFGTHYLPHDARAKQLGTGRSIEELLRNSGFKVRIVPMLRLADGINAARTIFPQCWFDADKCADGIQALRHYRYEMNDKLGKLSQEPLHDWASHPADAFRYAGVTLKVPTRSDQRANRDYEDQDNGNTDI